MTIKRISNVAIDEGEYQDDMFGFDMELEFTLTDQELREAAQEYNKRCKREDIRTQLRDMGVENMTDEDVNYMADQLVERLEYDESWYWSRVEETVNNYLGM